MMPSENRVLIAIELSVSSWFVAVRLPGSEKSRLHRVEGGDTTALLALIRDLRSRAETKLRHAADVACCFEAGRDGFWLHRLLTAHGASAYVLEPTSILVNRRARRAKTDRLDAEGMLRVLAAWLGGDRQVCSIVSVPTPEDEDAKRPHREREHLVQERQRLENRMEALLFTQGIRGRPSLRSWERDIAKLRTGDGRALPCLMQAELNRLRRRLVLILELIHEMEAERAKALAAKGDNAMTRKIADLQRIRGIGANFSTVLAREVLYRSFANRRQLASYVGIAPMPYQSGGMDRDRSISRAKGANDTHPARLAVAALSAWQRAFRLVPRPRRNAARADAPDRHRCHGKKAFDRTLAICRDRRVARWRRAEGDGRSDGLANSKSSPAASPPTTIREPRPSSSLVAFNYRVSGGSRSPGQRLVDEALWCGRPRRARPHVRLRSICCDAGSPGTRETVSRTHSSEDCMQKRN